VVSLDESSAIGRISKQWTGFEAEAFTDADNFGLQFPMDLDVKIKAVLLAACFLIVSMYTALIQTITPFKSESHNRPFCFLLQIFKL